MRKKTGPWNGPFPHVHGVGDQVWSLIAGSLLTSSAVIPICTKSPALWNLPSGIATSLVPKPRKPPVLTLIAVTLPSGWPSMLSTMPSLFPSDEKTGNPISGFVIGATTFLSPDPGTTGLARLSHAE